MDKYARIVGIYASMVYNCLCRYSDENKIVWPSISKIAENLGISKTTVVRVLKLLEFWNIIKKIITVKTSPTTTN